MTPGGGEVDVDDLLRQFDKDKSGRLDRAELVPILQQLMQQTEFTNGLLEQVSDLEERNFAMNRQVKQAQSHLTQAIEVGEQLREENEALRQSLESQESVRHDTSKEISRLRMTAEASDREAKSAHQAKANAVQEVANTRREAEELRRKLEDVEQLVATRDDAMKQEEIRWRRELENVRATNQRLTKNDSIHSSELAQLYADLKEATTRNEEQHRALEDAYREKASMTKHSHVLENSLKKIRSERDAALADADKARHDLQSVKSALAQKYESVLVENESQVQVTEREKLSLQSDLERAAAELIAMTQRHANEKKILEKRLTEAHADRAAAVQELAELAQRQALEVKQRSAEELEYRRDAEASYLRLQEVHAQQLELLAEARRDAQNAANAALEANAVAEAAQNELKEAHQRIHQYAEDANSAKQKAQDAHFTDEVRCSRLREDCTKRLRGFESRLLAMRQACSTLQNDMLDQHQTHTALDTTANLKSWHQDSIAAMTALVAAVREAKSKHHRERARAEGAERQVAEVNRSLEILTESEAQLEKRIEELTAQRDDSIRAYSDRLSVAKAETEAAEARRRQREERAKHLQLELDAMRTSATETDAEIRNLRTELAEAQASMSSKQLEAKIKSLTHANERANTQRQALEQEINRLRHALDSAQAQSQEEIAHTKAAHQDTQHTFQAQVSALKGNVSSLNSQLDKTKKLLSVLQQQRLQLQQDNDELTAQLSQRAAVQPAEKKAPFTTPRRPVSLSTLLSASSRGQEHSSPLRDNILENGGQQ